MTGLVCLMYHELERARQEPSRTEPGYLRYVVREADFRAQLNQLANGGLLGLNVGQALVAQPEGRPKLAITFDDGAQTDLVVAAPLLREAGHNATFFVTVGCLNQRGYLTFAQVRELHELGFEIGCHSMTHAFLTDCSPHQLQVEVIESRARLQDLIGAPVLHFSCPGGRWKPHISEIALSAGYVSVATSRIGVNNLPPNPLRLSRIPILRHMTTTSVLHFSQGKRLIRIRAGQQLRRAATSLLGNVNYEALRTRLLRSVK